MHKVKTKFLPIFFSLQTLMSVLVKKGSVMRMLAVQTLLVATTVPAILGSLEMELAAVTSTSVSPSRVTRTQLVPTPTEVTPVSVTVGSKEMEPFAHVSSSTAFEPCVVSVVWTPLFLSLFFLY